MSTIAAPELEQLDPHEDLQEESEQDTPTADALPFAAPSLRRKMAALEVPDEEEDQLDDEMPDFSLPRLHAGVRAGGPCLHAPGP